MLADTGSEETLFVVEVVDDDLTGDGDGDGEFDDDDDDGERAADLIAGNFASASAEFGIAVTVT